MVARKTPAKPRIRRLFGQRGASLIEIVIATLILSFISISMVEFFYKGRAGFDQEEHKRVAVLLAQEALERTVSLPYASIGPWNQARSVSAVDYAIAVTMQADTPENDMKTVRCTVTWDARPNVPRSVTLSTFVNDI